MTEVASPSRVSRLQDGIAEFVRFGLAQRIEHAVLLASFTTLGLTGLVQKYAAAAVSDWLIAAMGGIETTRLIHRTAAVVLLVEATFHVLAALYRIYVLRTPLTMLPDTEDFRHLYQDVMFYIGRRKRKAVYGRYSYAEKVEYLAVVWGTVIMAITGFMMWNPLAASRWFTGEAIPAAKAAHGGEALLAVLAIILWHFYQVHIRHLNKSMFTGRLTREEMQDEHPAELAGLEGLRPPARPAPEVVRRRQRGGITPSQPCWPSPPASASSSSQPSRSPPWAASRRQRRLRSSSRRRPRRRCRPRPAPLRERRRD